MQQALHGPVWKTDKGSAAADENPAVHSQRAAHVDPPPASGLSHGFHLDHGADRNHGPVFKFKFSGHRAIIFEPHAGAHRFIENQGAHASVHVAGRALAGRRESHVTNQGPIRFPHEKLQAKERSRPPA